MWSLVLIIHMYLSNVAYGLGWLVVMDKYHRDMCYDEIGQCPLLIQLDYVIIEKRKGTPMEPFTLTSYNLCISTPISMVSTKLMPSKVFNYLIFRSNVCGLYVSIFLIGTCI